MKASVKIAYSKPTIFVGILSLALLASPLPTIAVKPPPPPPQVSDPSVAGEIRGTLTAYGGYGAEGWDVYISGRSFFVRTGAAGTFVLNYVPAGTYSLVISREAVKVREMSGVVVTSRTLTNLGLVEVFLDADGDGHRSDVDCNDNDPTVYPGATEICDEIDNNCNGQVDEGSGNIYYRDADGDGYGDPNVTAQACSVPPGYVSNGGDCNDSNAGVNPGATEICDGIDNNCNGQVDEVAVPEICGDEIDNNCDGQVDEGCS